MLEAVVNNVLQNILHMSDNLIYYMLEILKN